MTILCKDCKFCNLNIAGSVNAFYDREADEVAKCLHDKAKLIFPAHDGRETETHPDYCSSSRNNPNKCGADAVWFIQKNG